MLALARTIPHELKRILQVALLAAAGLLLPACGGESPSAYDGPPIVVIGVDGLEWSVLKPLMDAGHTPNLKKLVDAGVGGYLETAIPTWSPVVWTSIGTGVDPLTHGILFFSEWDLATNRPKKDGLPYTSNCRKVPAIWNIVDGAGMDVLSVAWWISWPAEQLERGRIFASYAAQAQGDILWKASVWQPGVLPQLTWPASLEHDHIQALNDGAPGGPLSQAYMERFPEVSADWVAAKNREVLFRTAFNGDGTHVRIFKEELEKRIADLNMVYVGLPDVAGHFFWRYYEPEAYEYEVHPSQIEVQKDHIPLSYEVVDGWIGEIVEKLPERCRVMILSDHGMHAWNYENSNAKQSGAHEDAPPGVLIVSGSGVKQKGFVLRADGPIGSIMDITPTLLDWLGIALPPDMKGTPLRNLMVQGWREDHPLKRTEHSYAEGYRSATQPLQPPGDLDVVFQQKLLDEIGYSETLDTADTEEPAEPPGKEEDPGK